MHRKVTVKTRWGGTAVFVQLDGGRPRDFFIGKVARTPNDKFKFDSAWLKIGDEFNSIKEIISEMETRLAYYSDEELRVNLGRLRRVKRTARRSVCHLATK